MEPLVSTQWLEDSLDAPDLVVVDCSWHMPASGRDGRNEYLQWHIPGARFLDIDAVSDASDPAPHMLPAADAFATAMESAGIGSSERIVVYDNSDLRTAARGWLMLRHFGASRVAILNGGFQKWLAEGRTVETGDPARRDARFEAAEAAPQIVTKADILGGTGLPIIDARGRPRFEGSQADPRPGVAPGHIPGSRNLPYAALYEADGTFAGESEIRRLFAGAGIDPERPFVASCGSGVTASSLIFAAYLLGNAESRLYDGSWSEWGSDPGTPKATGPA